MTAVVGTIRAFCAPRISYEEYLPYGSTAWWAGSSGLVSQKRYRFTGMERDEETGLQCHGVRYYAVWLGRWVSADPIGLGDGVNRFGYCQGKPLACHDPSGMFSLPVWAIPMALTDYSQIEALQQRLVRVGLGSEFLDAAKEKYLVYSVPGKGAHTNSPGLLMVPYMIVGRDAYPESIVHEGTHAYLNSSSEGRAVIDFVARRMIGRPLSDGTQVTREMSLRAANEAMGSYVEGRVGLYLTRSESALRIASQVRAGELSTEEAWAELKLEADLFQNPPTSYGAFQSSGGSALWDEGSEVSLLDPLDSDVQEWLDVNVIGYRYDSFYDLPAAKGAMAAIRDAQAAEDRGIAP